MPTRPRPSAARFPWMVDIQSEILDKLPTRLVMPLALRAHMPAAMPRSLCPTIGGNAACWWHCPIWLHPFGSTIWVLSGATCDLRPTTSWVHWMQ
ncbi:CcdB family protein [Variovorax guangxiensis]|uniref:CcdB family protein n=1 Tax=Variovorax guangxiensis TaxID=1775474 RepID=UPI0028896050|nr:CcdB family protein [Variovorax guangxiensis]